MLMGMEGNDYISGGDGDDAIAGDGGYVIDAKTLNGGVLPGYATGVLVGYTSGGTTRC